MVVQVRLIEIHGSTDCLRSERKLWAFSSKITWNLRLSVFRAPVTSIPRDMNAVMLNMLQRVSRAQPGQLSHGQAALQTQGLWTTLIRVIAYS